MAPSTTTRTSRTASRCAGVVATATLASLLIVTPAFARPDPGERVAPGAVGSPRVDGSQLQYGPSAPTAPESAPQPGPEVVRIDDDAVEYLQIGLGALAGMAAMGAVVAASTRRHGHAHPA